MIAIAHSAPGNRHTIQRDPAIPIIVTIIVTCSLSLCTRSFPPNSPMVCLSARLKLPHFALQGQAHRHACKHHPLRGRIEASGEASCRCDENPHRISSGALTPKIPSPDASTAASAVISASRATVKSVRSSLRKRNCGRSLPRVQCPWKLDERSCK
jgi:hypothetical protein